MTELTCAGFTELAPELALGLLDGRERAAALAHAASCEACRRDLKALGGVADDLVELTPAAEPPPGFETSVISSLRGHHRRRRGRTRRIWALAAAAVVAVGVGIGGFVTSALSGGGTSVEYAGHPLSAPLMAGGHEMGEVMLADEGRPWLSMAVISHLGDTTVTCQVREHNGRVVTVGWFRLVGGDGFWASALPTSLSALKSAQLIAANGATIATANLQD